MNREDVPEPPAVARVTGEAEAMVQKLATLLQANGWDAIVISLSRAVEVAPGDWRAPGATATVVDFDRVAPIMPMLADVLRKQAAMLDEHGACFEPAEGYIHDRTDHASGRTRWPEPEGNQ